MVGYLLRLLGRGSRAAGPADEVEGPVPEAEGISFRELFARLNSEDPRVRSEVALLLSGLGHREAIRPLARSYLHFGDTRILDALSTYGRRLTPVVAGMTRDLSRSATQRARLMEVIGACGDPTATEIARRWTVDPDPVVSVAACAALSRLSDPAGIALLGKDLSSGDSKRRTLALSELRLLGGPEAHAALEEHVCRYLAEGGAVPSTAHVALPLLIRPETELPELIADHVRRSPQALTIVTGPETSALSENRRDEISGALPGHELVFTTRRHSPPEQLDVLRSARDEAATGSGARVVLIGPLPSPLGTHPLPHFLTTPGGRAYHARVIFVGPHDFNIVMEWWRYIEDRAEVRTDFEVILTALTLGGGALTDEELQIYQLTAGDRQEAFARALLAHVRSLDA